MWTFSLMTMVVKVPGDVQRIQVSGQYKKELKIIKLICII